MSLFFFDDPIRESDRSILNNSVVDDNKSDDNDDYNHPLVSGFPYFFGYPPYAYHPNSQATKSSNKPKSTPKSNNTTKRQSSQAFNKDVYKLVDFRPKNNLCEDDKNYYIQLDLPGMTKEQIHMELSEDNIIIISGERENKYKKAPNMKISKMECEYGKFSRSFSVPETADLDKIEAKMENGSLQVIIPKAEPPKNQRRTIQVQ
ncbi:HSP20-like chaperone [Neocallimastix lanati (nom. inval.)]|jgi:HSP20 family molecular chaperone IbpA|uniref:HSP20-like chaperone n=1 Tax=Neocallimastix californiae TaxID=1754190 RepID=A0A1Y2EX72_9FUNG|nr:HSP20-like chaperone [Neocallimastix sp. JGI-2020a]ORY76183.1 HSP20-like chaperone [Neocallimastix californiae]|eukprot:ORY76183.1 HSP20-like chaperone [Neocallimastix californiae]